MKFKNGDKASFFKILLSDSVDYLPLPTAFAKKYFLEKGDFKKQTLVLKPKFSVKWWNVKYVKIEEKYYFMDGWLKFMKENRLQKGDFLVFWLLSASTLEVFFYAPNGCLKHPIPTSGAGDVKKRCDKEETGDDVDSDDDSLVEVRKSFQRVFKKSRARQFPMNKSFWEAAGMYAYDGVRLRNDGGKTWEVKVSKYRRDSFPYLTTGWLDFWKGNKMTVGNMCEFSHVEGNLLHVHVIKKTRGKTMEKEPIGL